MLSWMCALFHYDRHYSFHTELRGKLTVMHNCAYERNLPIIFPNHYR